MSAEEYVVVDPRDLRFTQTTISAFFKSPYDKEDLATVVENIQKGLFDHSVFEPLIVQWDKDGIMRCKSNRRLWVLRKAGVPSVRVKVKSGDFRSHFLKDKDKARMSGPDAFPKIRGQSGNDKVILDDPNFMPVPITTQATESASYTGNSVTETWKLDRGNELMKFEESESSLPGILVAASAAVVAGFASWKLFKTIRESEK